MSHLQLQTTLKFTLDDLNANREGQLSEAQRTKYAPPKANKLLVAVILGHALLIVGLLGGIALVTGQAALWFVLLLVGGLSLIPLVLMNNEGNINPTLRGDVATGRVKKACGIAILTEHQGRQTYFELYIDGVTLRLRPAQARAFQNEALYCVYYLPASGTLLSAEPHLA